MSLSWDKISTIGHAHMVELSVVLQAEGIMSRAHHRTSTTLKTRWWHGSPDIVNLVCEESGHKECGQLRSQSRNKTMSLIIYDDSHICQRSSHADQEGLEVYAIALIVFFEIP